MSVTKKIPVAEMVKGIESLKPYREGSFILNEQHFYQNSTLENWSKKEAHPVTLRHLANFGKKITNEKLLASANFVRTELTTRLSLKIRELQCLPYEITSNYHISQVYQSYYHCFDAFRKVEKIESLEDNKGFCEFLENMLSDHYIVLPHLMMGALEVSVLQNMSPEDLDKFMSSMLRSRISRRVIMDQHVCMSKTFEDSKKLQNLDDDQVKPPDYVGEAFQYCSAHEHLNKSYKSIITFLQSIYPNVEMPELKIIGDDFKFQFMTNHLIYIFTEILRNALKRTIEQYIKLQDPINIGVKSDKPPPVCVYIVNTKYEMTFKFSDQGGGMPFEKMDKVWSFSKTPEVAKLHLNNFYALPNLDLPERLPITSHQYFKNRNEMEILKPSELPGVLANIGEMERSRSEKDNSTLSSLASRPFEYTLGISMPMCKVYTDYWNGTLDMATIDGYGCDVFLRLKKLGGTNDKLQLDKA